MKILVASGGWEPFYRSVLAITRCLDDDYQIFIAAPRYLSWMARSMRPSNCTDVLFVQDPEKDPLGFLEEIFQYNQTHRFDALLPCGDRVATLFSLFAKELGSQIPVPGITAYLRALDKGATLEVARQAGVPMPKTTIGDNGRDVLGWMAKKDVEFPIVLKARIKAGIGTSVVSDVEELATALRTFNEARDDYPFARQVRPLVQEYIPGLVHDCCGLYWHGRSKAMITQVRRRTSQGRGGVGAVNETTRNPRIISHSKTLLDTMRWHGPVQVEWIYDDRTDDYKLIEVNPRFWGTVELAIEAGMNVPAMTLALMKGDEVGQTTYRAGLTHRWVIPEQLQGALNAPEKRLRRLGELIDIRKLWNDEVRFTFDLHDPKPDLFRLIYFTTRALGRLRKRVWIAAALICIVAIGSILLSI